MYRLFFYVFTLNLLTTFEFRKVWLRLYAIALPNQSKLPDIKLQWCWVKDVNDSDHIGGHSMLSDGDKSAAINFWVNTKVLLQRVKGSLTEYCPENRLGLIPFVRFLSSFQKVLRSFTILESSPWEHLKGFESVTSYWKKTIMYD